MMLNAPNIFLIFWNKKDLLNWLEELKFRKRYRENDNSVPTLEQIKAELLRRK